MKKDVHKKRPGFSRSQKTPASPTSPPAQSSQNPAQRRERRAVGRELTRLLELSQELQTIYQTYPKLRAMVGAEAWQGLTDVVYGQLLELNLAPSNRQLKQSIELNLTRLEDLSASSLVRGDTGLRDTLSRVLIFRISNRLARDPNRPGPSETATT